ncbi:hypothetical protein NDU88_002764 [Pleurodeles waltl]|uniref:Uncharacterized protein n=1 Tax=Pleurodeles waltl TaxID=8319 RepID=A0AAV7NIM8_PLEWA|nr:hypothetical protein NDU88_002764 [Pleurodeles waltl]
MEPGGGRRGPSGGGRDGLCAGRTTEGWALEPFADAWSSFLAPRWNKRGSVCDGQARSGLSEEVAWADAAASDPETATSTPNPRALPGWTEQRQEIRVPRILKGCETPAGGRAEEGGVTTAEDERRQQRAADFQKSSGVWRKTGSTPEDSPAPAAAQEAYCDGSSHASGEAWLIQVRP